MVGGGGGGGEVEEEDGASLTVFYLAFAFWREPLPFPVLPAATAAAAAAAQRVFQPFLPLEKFRKFFRKVSRCFAAARHFDQQTRARKSSNKESFTRRSSPPSIHPRLFLWCFVFSPTLCSNNLSFPLHPSGEEMDSLVLEALETVELHFSDVH